LVRCLRWLLLHAAALGPRDPPPTHGSNPIDDLLALPSLALRQVRHERLAATGSATPAPAARQVAVRCREEASRATDGEEERSMALALSVPNCASGAGSDVKLVLCSSSFF
jgi:hypothetical protein